MALYHSGPLGGGPGGGHRKPETSSHEELGGVAHPAQLSGAGPRRPRGLRLPSPTFQDHGFQPRRQARVPGVGGGSEEKGLQERTPCPLPAAVPKRQKGQNLTQATHFLGSFSSILGLCVQESKITVQEGTCVRRMNEPQSGNFTLLCCP